jgi:hypothetical protein
MAGDGAGVADSGGGVWFIGIGRRRVAGDAGEKVLAQWSEGVCAGVERLDQSACTDVSRCDGTTYVWQDLARICF